MRKDQFAKGLSEYKAGRYKTAARLFLDAIKSDDDTRAWKSLGISRSKYEDHKAWYALGLCLLRLGQKKRGVQCLKNAIQLAPDKKKYRRALHQVTKISLSDKVRKNFETIKKIFGGRRWNTISKIFNSLLPSRSFFSRIIEILRAFRSKTSKLFLNNNQGRSNEVASAFSKTSGVVNSKANVRVEKSSGRFASSYLSNDYEVENNYSERNFEDYRKRKANGDLERALVERRLLMEDEEIEELLALDII